MGRGGGGTHQDGVWRQCRHGGAGRAAQTSAVVCDRAERKKRKKRAGLLRLARGVFVVLYNKKQVKLKGRKGEAGEEEEEDKEEDKKIVEEQKNTMSKPTDFNEKTTKNYNDFYWIKRLASPPSLPTHTYSDGQVGAGPWRWPGTARAAARGAARARPGPPGGGCHPAAHGRAASALVGCGAMPR